LQHLLNLKTKSNKTIDDLAIWQAFKKGDKEAFAQIYQHFIDELLRYGYRVTTDRQLIKDSIQDLFLHLWNTRENLSDTDSIRFYLYRSLRNRILKNIENSQEEAIDSMAVFENILHELSIEEKVIGDESQSEQVKKLRNAIQQLPKRQQEAIQLRYYHDFSLDEIAEIMQVNNQSVRNFLHRAISDLRENFYLLSFLLFNLILSQFN
jgi:RNA polymerase sigma factor (sigma-70 family)